VALALAGSADQPVVSIDRVTLQYRTDKRLVTAIYQVSLDVLEADRYVILGPSGCGKSTLLKAVAGFLAPASGSIRLAGRPVTGPGPDRMMVFQDLDQLFPWQTVEENVASALRRAGGIPRAEAAERAGAIIGRVGLAGFAAAYPHTLSGGMKQRAALARALALRPRMLLMDEPFAAWDALTRAEMQRQLLDLWTELRFTVLFVTHSVEEAILIGTRILILTPHPGRVRAELAGLPPGADAADREALKRRIDALIFDAPILDAPILDAPILDDGDAA
jgi:NitT/TauT family transport system ATP-binding protein